MTLLRDQFLGISRPQLVTRLDGSTETVPSVYLDSAATSLMPIPVLGTMVSYLVDSQANAHSKTAARGRATTAAMNRTRQLLLDLVGGDPGRDCVVFAGSGATGPLNLLAEILLDQTDRVLVSQMEHHSNILPWARRGSVAFFDTHDDGTIDMADFDRLLDERPKVVAVSAMSNVTGVVNPIHEIARRAHAVGAIVVVDASQAAPHIAIEMRDIDFIVLSGHKLYAPGSPGVLIGRRDLLTAAIGKCGNQGGGIVQRVDLQDGVTFVTETPDGLEAGTADIPGIVALGAACLFVKELGIGTVHDHDVRLSMLLMRELAAIQTCVTYGPMRPEERGGIVAFNLLGIAHGLVAAVLNDFFGIAVRNDCFCAQPYVRSMLDAACNQRGFCAPVSEGTKRGMVRASFSPFTTEADVLRLGTAVHWIEANVKALEALYENRDGVFTHRSFSTPALFNLDRAFYQAL